MRQKFPRVSCQARISDTFAFRHRNGRKEKRKTRSDVEKRAQDAEEYRGGDPCGADAALCHQGGQQSHDQDAARAQDRYR